ncbi:NACHT, LRR and PYD domains-containing protein 12 isoform X2 [Puntigrus tetrazona]|uniref:NACHT, LRR and PYD domains-containing protein 12 isoform X2 n=1 Tax=Puntigrus tetrazona TaxID=1606681 RepID=UPI001C89FBAD|nr:NACHT, LRR and PYD domains-containing protein 12 isoform X2 [Puntigrus tetrazona]
MYSEISYDVQQVHKEALRNTVLSSTLPSSLLGGQPVSEVIQRGHYTPLSASAYKVISGFVKRGDREALEDVISQEFSPGSEGRRLVLYGDAGMGKTTAVEKIMWDWTSGTRLQHYTLLMRIPVRELAALGGKAESLRSMLGRMHTHISTETLAGALQRPQSLLLALDGLEQLQHLPCTPSSSPSLVCDVQQEATGSVLLYSLLHGSLLAEASMLITSRKPFEPLSCFEVVGFSQTQRRTFFRCFFGDEGQAERLYRQCEQSLGVYEQCFHPAFCWTLCNVLQTQSESKNAPPETLTHLLGVITHMLLQKQKMHAEQSRVLVSCLGQLTSLVCSNSDVTSCGLRSFLHHPVLSAFLRINGDATSPDSTFSFLSPVMHEFLSAASFYLDQSVQEISDKRSGLYHTFLAGLSDSVQRKPIEDSVGKFNESRISAFSQWMVGNVSRVLPGIDATTHFGVFRLLHHARNSSLVKESILKAQWRLVSYSSMQEADCAALSYVVSCVGEMEHMNLYGAELTDEQVRRLIPALRLSKSIGLSQSRLGLPAITHLFTALAEGRTVTLDLSHAKLEKDWVKTVCHGLTLSTLESLNMSSCELTGSCCSSLAAALQSETCRLTELDLSVNDLGQSGAMQICDALMAPTCTLEILKMSRCELTEEVFRALGSVLTSGVSKLVSLSVAVNDVGDAGAKHILEALRHKHCKLQHLNLEMVSLTDACVEVLCQSVAACNTLSTLILKNNVMTDSSVPRLVKLMQGRPLMTELNLKYNDFSEDVIELMDTCPNIIY